MGELKPYLDRFTVCSGKLHCPEAEAWARELNRELVGFAREAEDRSYARLSRRGILMRFFRDLLHKDVQGERDALQRGPVGLLAMLPKEFTREQVRDLRIKQGMSPDPRCMLSIWKKRGIIIEGESPNTYVRV